MNRLYRALTLVEMTFIGISILSTSWRIPALICLQSTYSIGTCLINFSNAHRGSKNYLDALDGSLALAIFTPVFITIFTPYYVLSALCLIEALVLWSTVVQVKEYLRWRASRSLRVVPAEIMQPEAQTVSLGMQQKPVEQAA